MQGTDMAPALRAGCSAMSDMAAQASGAGKVSVWTTESIARAG